MQIITIHATERTRNVHYGIFAPHEPSLAEKSHQLAVREGVAREDLRQRPTQFAYQLYVFDITMELNGSPCHFWIKQYVAAIGVHQIRAKPSLS